MLDWRDPPTSEEEMPLWRAFVATVELEVWQVIHRWVTRYGNPFVVPEEESYDDAIIRHRFCEAIRIVYDKER